MIEQLKEWLRQIDAGSMAERDLYPLVKNLVASACPDCGERNPAEIHTCSPLQPAQSADHSADCPNRPMPDGFPQGPLDEACTPVACPVCDANPAPSDRRVSAEQWKSLAESATLAIQIGESIKDRAKRLGLPCPTCGNPPHALAAAQAEVKRLREAAMDAVAEVLGDAYDCTRVWSAWSYGTMSQDDFCLVAEDAERLGEIVDAVIKVLAPNAAPQPDSVAALEAECERLREGLEALLSKVGSAICGCGQGQCCKECDPDVTPADTSELYRLVADAGRAKWRRVGDEMPAPKTDVLVRCLRGNGETFDVAGLFHGEWMSCATERYTKGTVTHWMPLPDAPDAARAEVKS